jgi:putative two-component system response regulator
MAVAGNGKAPRILIVDDEEANVRLLERILRRVTSADLRSTTDSRTVMTLYTEFKPDLILLDLRMPHIDGFGVLDALRPMIPADSYVPILVLTADITPEAKQQALSSGAKDFLTKPFDPTEILLRITNLLETRALHVDLEERVRSRTRELEGAHLETVERLALAVEYREDGTGGHTRRVGQMSALLARALGLPQTDVMLIRQAAPLHDVGKIAIPDRILLKTERLTADEWTIMKTHTTIGAKIVGGGRYSLLLTAEAIALSHHERWDGMGYPRGLSGESITLPARIVAVADAFDAMTHKRPYREAYPEDYALAELQRCAGTHFDPKCVESFGRLIADPEARALLALPAGAGAAT